LQKLQQCYHYDTIAYYSFYGILQYLMLRVDTQPAQIMASVIYEGRSKSSRPDL